MLETHQNAFDAQNHVNHIECSGTFAQSHSADVVGMKKKKNKEKRDETYKATVSKFL